MDFLSWYGMAKQKNRHNLKLLQDVSVRKFVTKDGEEGATYPTRILTFVELRTG